MATDEEVGPSRADGIDHNGIDHKCSHDPIVPHIIVPFIPMLMAFSSYVSTSRFECSMGGGGLHKKNSRYTCRAL